MFVVTLDGYSNFRKIDVAGYGSRLARSLPSGAHSRDPLAWPGRRRGLLALTPVG
jgi:hypothetical protein